MQLSPGTMLGQYEIRSLIGAGGMGEVYLGYDTKLKRDVALKVLPEAFARDAERVARFRREATLLASLNHPNIAAIYGLEESGSRPALVMEYVPGETLAEMIHQSRARQQAVTSGTASHIPLDEALGMAKQIADALEHAHEKTIVHRDLKPANVKVTPEGDIKVLDFGLAKAFANESVSAVSGDSPTLSAMPTQPGVILGTAAYMSPEQAKGKKVDRRTDVWAFGCVLYELLTGQKAFQGETVTEILASILKGEPDWSLLPADTPANLRFVLRRCLTKDPKQRLRDAADVRIQIEEAESAPAGPTMSKLPAQAKGLRRPIPLLHAALVAAVLAVAVGLGVWLISAGPGSDNSPVMRLNLALPPGDQFSNPNGPLLAFSPDGAQIAYVAQRGDGRPQLWLRSLDGTEAKPLPGTDGASYPFFSPDGQWIGYFALGKLRKIAVVGGASQVICDATGGRGGSWSPDGTIFFAPNNISGLWKVSASGGQPQEVTKLDRNKGEVSHRWPQVLPGGKAVLLTVWTGPGSDEKQVAVQILDTGERRVLVQGGSTGRYMQGSLIYNRAGTLMALPLDVDRFETGNNPPLPVAEAVQEGSEGSIYAVTDSGLLGHLTGRRQGAGQRLVWVDRTGAVEALPTPPQGFNNLTISPDGRRAAVSIAGAMISIWLYDLSRNTMTRLTSEEGSSQGPIWTPDGKRIVYRGTRAGFRNLYWKAADGTGAEEKLTSGQELQTPGSLSSDGKWLSFDGSTGLWLLPLEGDRKPRLFLNSPGNLTASRFSPDGRWIAYRSDESGRSEIYAAPFPGPGEKLLISTEGGAEPMWARNGRELYYRNENKMMAVEISSHGANLTVGRPRALFEGNFVFASTQAPAYDVGPDGRFLMIQPTEPEQAATQINVVLNWQRAVASDK